VLNKLRDTPDSILTLDLTGDRLTQLALSGQAGIVGHITVGDNAIIGAQSGVTKSVAPNREDIMDLPITFINRPNKATPQSMAMPATMRPSGVAGTMSP